MPGPCIAREPLAYGSRACSGYGCGTSELCEGHAHMLWPHKLIGGVLYVNSGLDEHGEQETNPYRSFNELGELARDNAQLCEQNELLRQAVREESAERRRLEQEVARRYALV